MSFEELREFLNEKVTQYQRPEFLEEDPIQIPHRFQLKEDIEIAGLLTATIAWGNRKSILRSATAMMELMDNSPYRFCLEASEKEIEGLKGFVHRTFNGEDLSCFVLALREIYNRHNGLETLFTAGFNTNNIVSEPKLPLGPAALAISHARSIFFDSDHPQRSEKHFADPIRGSAAKRLNMYLRWMVRPADAGVDFGLWKQISPSQLSCPLDVHSGNVARSLGLLKRKQNDARAVFELDAKLKQLDPSDPVRYDFALFGLGVYEGFANKVK
ncbi:TIGR02757 family protein [Robiginitalea myxolifaciens]|uniref:TIGR02757 family protein n=1 Tax=Robiginitalea myxolifaciens TaxID=400055 RepID=A0A1I6GVN7_9FLAO|nr:TIGR02757 family protein [Robiginitalea myxolifaciens]SFR46216.1 TIGR02757 family protein [Robiginitalea myxolifaciens]